MRTSAELFSASLVFLLSLPILAPVSRAQATAPAPVRDAQATALLQGSITAMGQTIPSDSVATGTVTILAGSDTEQGTIRILTRGASQTSVQMQTSTWNTSVIFSNGEANSINGSANVSLPLETVASSQSVYFPQQFLGTVLNNPDESIQYVGLETVNGASAQHVLVWNTYNSNPSMQFLSSFTATDIWLDSTSGLPRRIQYIHRDGGGAAPKILRTVDYSNYQTVQGINFPMTITESVNGTVWATSTIQSVNFNTGLSETNFPVSVGAY
jgi:hypothetical protein